MTEALLLAVKIDDLAELTEKNVRRGSFASPRLRIDAGFNRESVRLLALELKPDSGRL